MLLNVSGNRNRVDVFQKLAAETIFSRNPERFDDPDRLERLFNPTTTTQLHDLLSKDSESFRTQQIHEKFESGVVKELTVDATTALVSVDGQVIRHGISEGKVVDDSKPVTVFLRLRSIAIWHTTAPTR